MAIDLLAALQRKREQIREYIAGIDPTIGEVQQHAKTIAEGRLLQIELDIALAESVGSPNLRVAVEDHLEWMTNGHVVNGVHYDEPSARQSLEAALRAVPDNRVHRPDLIGLLSEAEGFISGFEGDELQEDPVDDLLERMRTAISDSEEARPPQLAIIVDGGLVTGVVSDRPEAFADVKIRTIDFDVFDGEFLVAQKHLGTVLPDEPPARAHVCEWEIEQATIDLDGIQLIPDEVTARGDELAGMDDEARDR